MMKQIPPERAFWILDFYHRHGTKLHLAASILHERCAALTAIMDVSPSLRCINVRVFEDDSRWSWDREIPLGDVRYFFSQSGNTCCKANNSCNCDFHTALKMEFPDGAMLYFTEQLTSVQGWSIN